MMIDAHGVTKTFPGDPAPVAVLSGVDLSLAAGETLALTGDSGSGKSTFLHILAGLEPFDGGTLKVAGTDMHRLPDAGAAALRRGTVGLVFQQFNLVPSLTVDQNIAFQARIAGRTDPGWTARLTERLGLAGLGGRYPEELSGGQQQRVAIARTLAPRPALVLADEPTGNLDEDASDAVLALMLELVAEAGSALLTVTHSASVAARMGRRLHLSHGRLGA